MTTPSRTLEALSLRVVMASFPGPVLPAWAADRLARGLGGVCLFGSNVSSTPALAQLVAAVHDAGRQSGNDADHVLVATDEEGGDVTRLHMREGSPHPGNAALGAADDVELTERVARSIGVELAGVGIDLDLAPVVDVNSNPDNPVIGVRSFGADPDLVARHTRAYVTGLQSTGVGACVKHFPGHGETSVDSHLGLATVLASRDQLDTRELPPFAAAVQAGTVAVMTSHVLLPALDTSLPATLSRPVLSMLRTDLGFDGLLVSDALDMRGASGGRGVPAAAVAALVAGCDLLCLGADRDAALVDAVVAAIMDAVTTGALDEERLTEAAHRGRQAGERIRDARLAARLDAVPGELDHDASRQAAIRAIAVCGDLPVLRGATVLRFVTSTNIAVGAVPWGLPPDGAVLDSAAPIDVVPDSRVDDLLVAARGTSVVALVREPHRHPWVAEKLAALGARRPDLVVVEMGWPGGAPLPGAATVCTYGASPANAAALDAVLTGQPAVTDGVAR